MTHAPPPIDPSAARAAATRSGIPADATIVERSFQTKGGWGMIILAAIVLLGAIAFIGRGAATEQPGLIVVGVLGVPAFVLLLCGLFVVNPNDSRALVLFGRYRGTVRAVGFHWTNPFTIKHRVSLRVRTFETAGALKVNDLDGNPIEIAAVVVWRVVDTAESLFAVDNYEKYVQTQSEAALRNLASRYHYDSPDPSAVSLRGSTDLVGARLKEELDGRLRGAGVEVLESRISRLSYASEIAAAMLQRQQATAVVAARQKIVEGAVGMVDLAMQAIEEKKLAHFTPEQKAQMVSNLLMVLVSERGAQPVVSATTA